MEATTPTPPRTPHAEAALRRANAEAYRLASDPERCISLWERLALPIIPPERRGEAKRAFRANIVDDQFRLAFALFVFRGAVELYAAGCLDAAS